MLLPHDYLDYYLTGQFRMEYGDASGTALMDVRERIWAHDILEFIDPALAEKMPTLCSSRRAVGTLLPELAKRWNLAGEIVVSAGGGDNMMGAIGTGNVEPGRVTASLGTSGTIYAYSATPVIDPTGEVPGFCDSTDAWLPLICTMNVTVATEAARKLFGWTHAEFNEAVATVPAGAEGLLFLPYLQGERTPNLPHGTGVFHGLTPAHDDARAPGSGDDGGGHPRPGLRSAAHAQTSASRHRKIRLTGGGSKSAAWQQICADVFQSRVVTLVEAEGAALGAAIQALALAQPKKTVTEWSNALVELNETEATVPDESRASITLRRWRNRAR